MSEIISVQHHSYPVVSVEHLTERTEEGGVTRYATGRVVISGVPDGAPIDGGPDAPFAMDGIRCQSLSVEPVEGHVDRRVVTFEELDPRP